MREFRLLLLLLVFGGLGIFALQNVSPVLPVVFLGTQSVAFPLSVLILGAVAGGAIASFIIFSLFRLSNHLSAQEFLARRRPSSPQIPRNYSPQPPRDYPPPRESAPAQQNTVLQSNWSAVAGTQAVYADSMSGAASERVEDAPRGRSSSSQERDDYYQEPVRRTERDDYQEPVEEDDEALYEDWEEEGEVANRPAGEPVVPQNPPTYEVKQEPTTSSWAGSIYSYGYREPSESGVGRTESVYDADYRVVKPPSDEPAAQGDDSRKKNARQDDWDWDDPGKRNSSKDW